ncbi:hypothetical protein IFM89_004338 [Coptis chinensis]|uniref:Mechanosensitive channel protein 2/3 transmembrane domain-containing protein n=1 Tax=Coptis chinensis TaxID=261450 RepID=A0A835M1H7_9MAGN|nr:hypothetical protein IFM89_004338 [Coptis chinensis]
MFSSAILSLIPGQANEIPILKTAVTAVSRYCSFSKLYWRSQESLYYFCFLDGVCCWFSLFYTCHVTCMVAVLLYYGWSQQSASFAFVVWGLAPFLRHSRNIFLCGSTCLQVSIIRSCNCENNIYLCLFIPSARQSSISLSTVLAFAYCLLSLIQQTQKFFIETNDSNDTRNMGFQFAGKAVYTAVWVAAVSLFMELLGFSTQKWLTAGGLGTVLLTLAGREV